MSEASAAVVVHASAVAVGGVGILVRGPARSGKSALAWSLLRRAELLGRPAGLVGDDGVRLRRDGNAVLASAPVAIRGLIELSGVGILAERAAPETPLLVAIDLVPPDAAERLPDPTHVELLGVRLRRLALPARQAAFGADILQGLLFSPGRSVNEELLFRFSPDA